MKQKTSSRRALSVLTMLSAGVFSLIQSNSVLAHDPVFGTGPHVLFKDGTEISLGAAQNRAGNEKESEITVEYVYGITADWAAGVELPYAMKEDDTASANGLSDIHVFTKYRFWRADSRGLQRSAAIMLAANSNNGDKTTQPALGNGAIDFMTGITYGYESLEKYRWASLRYLKPGENNAGFQAGEKIRLDFVVGWRPTLPEYKKPDTVWLLELNGEASARASLQGTTLENSGGTEWFLSPGIFWTTRNFAIKAGIQLPLTSDLNGSQNASDYRFKSTFEWHL